MLVDLQALAAQSFYAPKRTVNGMDQAGWPLLLAVLESGRACGFITRMCTSMWRAG